MARLAKPGTGYERNTAFGSLASIGRDRHITFASPTILVTTSASASSRTAAKAAMADWLIEKTHANAEHIYVAIEVPHGPVVETLIERGFNVNAIKS